MDCCFGGQPVLPPTLEEWAVVREGKEAAALLRNPNGNRK